ncbi:T9SS type A sorting domain-containing protein [bacterium]|nr:T9SS type A sorting domain-containing protein [bacterium]
MHKFIKKYFSAVISFVVLSVLSVVLVMPVMATPPVVIEFEKRTVENNVDGPIEICSVDLDSDGDIDIISIVEGAVYWWENDGAGNFTMHLALNHGGLGDAIDVGDMDGDNDIDIVVGGRRIVGGYGSSNWLENDGSENFTLRLFPIIESAVLNIIVSDIDLDGDLDVIYQAWNEADLKIFVNNGTGYFTRDNIPLGNRRPFCFDTGDMDNDGDIDVVAGAVDVEEIIIGEYLASIDNYTPRVVDTNFIDPTDVVVVDLDQDNDMDILATSEGLDQVVWYENNLSMSFTKHVITSNFDGAQAVVAVDMDGDSDLDVLACAKVANDIIWWENDGSENFTQHVIDDNYGGILDVLAADLDGDGDPDVAASTYEGDRIDWWESGPMYWNQDFTGGTSGVQPIGWYDETDDSVLNAQIVYSATAGLANVSTVSGESWGKVLSFSQDINVDNYRILEVTIDSISNGTVKIAVFSQTSGWEEYICSSSLSSPGTYYYDIPTASGWSGVKNMGVELISESGSGVVVIDQIRIHNEGMPAPTLTPTPTETPDTGDVWKDHFVGTTGNQVVSWEDETNNTSHNAEIAYAADSFAEITLATGETWGNVLSPSQAVNVVSYPAVEVNVSGISSSTSWKLGIQETEGSWRFWDISGSMTGIGTFAFNYSSITGLSGASNLAVVLTLEGGTGAFMEMDYVRITDSTGLPTPTPTPTATPSNAYFTGFDDVNGWLDESDDSSFNAYITRIGTTVSYAKIDRIGAETWGKVQSPLITCDVDTYSFAELQVVWVDTDTSWKIGIQEEGGSYIYFDLSGSQTGTGTFEYDFATATGWSGIHTFRVQLVVEGVFNKEIHVDWLRVGGDETVMGSSVVVSSPTPSTSTPTLTPTKTPNVTMTLTPTPQATSQQPDTATPTRTMTATPTPYLAVNKVLPYPNPARGKVNFAYTISGAGKVVIDIYKLTGERVANITEHVNGGTGQTLSTAWNAVDVAPGIYFCRIVITDGSGKVILNQKKKVALIK